MKTTALLFVGLLLLSGAIVSAQDLVVTGFPLGVGGSVDHNFFEPYRADLKAVADTLHKYPSALAVIVGAADGERFRENSDAKNPGLALGRAHALRNWLIRQFNVDSTRLIIQSKDVSQIGPHYRSVSIRVIRERRSDTQTPSTPPPPLAGIAAPLPVSDLTEHMGLQIGAGLSTSPYGAIPYVSGAVTWKRLIFFEGTLGYTFWNGAFTYQGVELDTRRRMAGGQLVVYPFNRLPLGIVAGWVRVEELSQAHYSYVRLSEGPIIGARATLFDIVTATGAINPVKQRVAGIPISRIKNGQLMLSVGVHKTFGGSR
ncbi:MAG: hypothetical protein HY851_00265 [candidate division Zixibacteria bacterium]|nr:hypothetical protein [candidate division Zixibacteria bacterium]